MENKIKEAIEEYQCSGCVCGSGIECYEKGGGEECKKHVIGTLISGIGKIFLGMPKGFDRLGVFHTQKICIFSTFSNGWGYNKFNIPVWKYLDQKGNVLVRGLSPRTNTPFLHIFLCDCLKEIDCLEITNKDIDEMD
jgi:hypothetical protein